MKLRRASGDINDIIDIIVGLLWLELRLLQVTHLRKSVSSRTNRQFS